MSAITDSVNQPIEEGDFVIYASGSRAAGSNGRIGRVVDLKKKVKVQFHRADGTAIEAQDHSVPLNDGSLYEWTSDEPQWLAAESLVVVTALKTWKPQVSA